MPNGTMPVKTGTTTGTGRPIQQQEKGWIATIIDAACGKAADTAVQKVTESSKTQLKTEVENVKAVVDTKVESIVDGKSGNNGKYLILGAFLMSAVSLGLEIWNMNRGSRAASNSQTTVNVYYDRPKTVKIDPGAVNRK